MNCRDSLSSCFSSASQALMAAALVGLLSAAACDDTEAPSGATTNSSGGAITSSIVDSDMTREKFRAICNEKGGRMEDHSHCGGANSCKGMSYDIATHVYSEHTCKGLNTCTGFSCVLP